MSQPADPGTIAARAIVDKADHDETLASEALVRAHLESFYALVHLTPILAPTPEQEEYLRATLGIGTTTKRGVGDPWSEVDSLQEVDADDTADSVGTAQTDGAGTPVHDRSRGRVLQKVLQGLSLKIRVPVLLAVVVLGIVVGLTASTVRLSTRGEFIPREALYLGGTVASPDAQGVLLHDGTRLVIHLSGLPDLAPGYRYVVWDRSDEEPLRIGRLVLLGASRGSASFASESAPRHIEITIESESRPLAPGGPVVVVGVVD